MSEFLANSFLPILAIIAFAAVVLLVEGLHMLWNSHRGPDARKIEKRLLALSAGSGHSEQAAVLKNRLLSGAPAIEQLLLAIPRIKQLDQFVVQSGLDWRVEKLLWVSLVSGATAYILFSVLAVPYAVRFGLSLAALLLPWGYVQRMRGKRLRRMGQQLPDALDLIGRALRAGHALPSGLQMVGDDMEEPIASEFRTLHDEIKFGVPLQQALTNLSERVPSTDVRYFVVAVLVQRESGGNLTELLDNLSKLIHDRIKFHAKVKVLSAEGRMSAWILGLLPFALAALLNVANHDFISVLWTDPAGIMITDTLAGMMAVGAVWLYKLSQIRV